MYDSFFKLKVGGISKPSDDEIHISLSAVVHRKPLKRVNLHIRKILKSISQKLFSLLQRKHIFFLYIMPYGNDDFIKKFRRPFYNIIMSQGTGSKDPGNTAVFIVYF